MPPVGQAVILFGKTCLLRERNHRWPTLR